MSAIRLTICMVVISFSLLEAQTPQLDSKSAAAIKDLLAKFDSSATAAGKLDPNARLSLFSEDAHFLNAWGGHLKGHAAIDSALNRLYTGGIFDSARIEILSREQRVIAPGIVIVDHLECLTGQRGPNSGREMPPRATHITLLLRQEPDSQWRIVYYRAGDMREFAQRALACERLRPGADRRAPRRDQQSVR